MDRGPNEKSNLISRIIQQTEAGDEDIADDLEFGSDESLNNGPVYIGPVDINLSGTDAEFKRELAPGDAIIPNSAAGNSRVVIEELDLDDEISEESILPNTEQEGEPSDHRVRSRGIGSRATQQLGQWPGMAGVMRDVVASGPVEKRRVANLISNIEEAGDEQIERQGGRPMVNPMGNKGIGGLNQGRRWVRPGQMDIHPVDNYQGDMSGRELQVSHLGGRPVADGMGSIIETDEEHRAYWMRRPTTNFPGHMGGRGYERTGTIDGFSGANILGDATETGHQGRRWGGNPVGEFQGYIVERGHEHRSYNRDVPVNNDRRGMVGRGQPTGRLEGRIAADFLGPISNFPDSGGLQGPYSEGRPVTVGLGSIVGRVHGQHQPIDEFYGDIDEPGHEQKMYWEGCSVAEGKESIIATDQEYRAYWNGPPTSYFVGHIGGRGQEQTGTRDGFLGENILVDDTESGHQRRRWGDRPVDDFRYTVEQEQEHQSYYRVAPVHNDWRGMVRGGQPIGRLKGRIAADFIGPASNFPDHGGLQGPHREGRPMTVGLESIGGRVLGHHQPVYELSGDIGEPGHEQRMYWEGCPVAEGVDSIIATDQEHRAYWNGRPASYFAGHIGGRGQEQTGTRGGFRGDNILGNAMESGHQGRRWGGHPVDECQYPDEKGQEHQSCYRGDPLHYNQRGMVGGSQSTGRLDGRIAADFIGPLSNFPDPGGLQGTQRKERLVTESMGSMLKADQLHRALWNGRPTTNFSGHMGGRGYKRTGTIDDFPGANILGDATETGYQRRRWDGRPVEEFQRNTVEQGQEPLSYYRGGPAYNVLRGMIGGGQPAGRLEGRTAAEFFGPVSSAGRPVTVGLGRGQAQHRQEDEFPGDIGGPEQEPRPYWETPETAVQQVDMTEREHQVRVVRPGVDFIRPVSNYQELIGEREQLWTRREWLHVTDGLGRAQGQHRPVEQSHGYIIGTGQEQQVYWETRETAVQQVDMTEREHQAVRPGVGLSRNIYKAGQHPLGQSKGRTASNLSGNMSERGPYGGRYGVRRAAEYQRSIASRGQILNGPLYRYIRSSSWGQMGDWRRLYNGYHPYDSILRTAWRRHFGSIFGLLPRPGRPLLALTLTDEANPPGKTDKERNTTTAGNERQ